MNSCNPTRSRFQTSLFGFPSLEYWLPFCKWSIQANVNLVHKWNYSDQQNSNVPHKREGRVFLSETFFSFPVPSSLSVLRFNLTKGKKKTFGIHSLNGSSKAHHQPFSGAGSYEMKYGHPRHPNQITILITVSFLISSTVLGNYDGPHNLHGIHQPHPVLAQGLHWSSVAAGHA